MHRDFHKPACWTDTATPRTWGCGRDATWCKAWRDRREMLKYQPGCDGCARAPHTHRADPGPDSFDR